MCIRDRPYACAAGAIGGGLADLLTAPVCAPATIIIKMLICLPFSSKGTKLVTKRNVVALFLAFASSATGYYIDVYKRQDLRISLKYVLQRES